MCREGNFALKLHSDSDIPFAVRLVELGLDSNKKNLVIKPGVPNLGGTLGAPAPAPAGFIDKAQPVIGEMAFTPRNRR